MSKRRAFIPEFKAQVVLEELTGVKEEEVDLSEYLDYHGVCRQLVRFLDDVYAHKRIHSSPGYLTPAEFEAQWRDEHVLVLEVELENA